MVGELLDPVVVLVEAAGGLVGERTEFGLYGGETPDNTVNCRGKAVNLVPVCLGVNLGFKGIETLGHVAKEFSELVI
jgi:hypothetical protein